jgi:hypothetical protein
MVIKGVIKVADGIKFANQLTLRCEDYPGYSKWPQYYHMDLYK